MAKYVIKVPPKATPLEADNWRSVAAALNELAQTSGTVNNKTTGIVAVSGKVKINEWDKVSDYLEDKIEAGNDIDFVTTNDGLGSKKYTVNLKVYAAASAPSSPTDQMLWYDTDEPEPEYFTIGDGGAFTYKLKFDGAAADCIITWNDTTGILAVDSDLDVNADLTSDTITTPAATITTLTAAAYNIVCYDNELVCYENEVVSWT